MSEWQKTAIFLVPMILGAWMFNGAHYLPGILLWTFCGMALAAFGRTEPEENDGE